MLGWSRVTLRCIAGSQPHYDKRVPRAHGAFASLDAYVRSFRSLVTRRQVIPVGIAQVRRGSPA